MTKIFSFLFDFFQGYSTSIQNRKSYASALESVNGCQLLSLHLLYIQKLSVLLVSKNSIWKKSTWQTRRAFLLLFLLSCFFFFVFLFVCVLEVCHSIVVVITLVCCLLLLFVRLWCGLPRSPFLPRALKLTKFSRFIFLKAYFISGSLSSMTAFELRFQEEAKDNSPKNGYVGRSHPWGMSEKWVTPCGGSKKSSFSRPVN